MKQRVQHSGRVYPHPGRVHPALAALRTGVSTLWTGVSCPGSPQHPKLAAMPVCDGAAQEGDIIVAATDGLWDNCFDEEIVSVLK